MRFAPLFAIAFGVLLAVLVGSIGKTHAAWAKLGGFFSAQPEAVSATHVETNDPRQLDHLKPQKQAETLLELAVSHPNGALAINQISSRVDRWQGKLKWDAQMATLTTAALNSSDMRVRESGVEVELAAYGLAKNPASLDYLLKTAESPDHAQKIWALWALGLMGNRGVGTGRVLQVLTAHLKDSDEESRRWAVEGLALVGTNEAIGSLLQAMHDDPSPGVRDRAACSLAESGMFTREQRFGAVPQLLSYTDDPALDAQTHAWAFQALGDITGQRLPGDSAAWRSWYDSTRGN
ncbi:MAG TPA: HEAT repeat domain-containing protein [Candidatus Sulfotelmatobacter sp.]|nr:HEAT repeat domain-containing protein [Candidatus Sulfotelmatobacter sp.]